MMIKGNGRRRLLTLLKRKHGACPFIDGRDSPPIHDDKRKLYLSTNRGLAYVRHSRGRLLSFCSLGLGAGAASRQPARAARRRIEHIRL